METMISDKLKLNLKFDNDFFREETKSGFFITTKRKELWSVLLDLLNELQRVCDKYNMKVIADGGTLLGAIRHEGFIPWDDDIDVLMFRDDFNKLQEIASKEFRQGYFLQNIHSDNIVRPHMQLRKDGTTMLIVSDYKTSFHKGAFIDIFVLDYIPDDPDERIRFRKTLHKKYWKLVKPRPKHIVKRDSLFRKILKLGWNVIGYPIKLIKFYLGTSTKRFILEKYEEWEKTCAMYNKKTNFVGNMAYVSTGRRALMVAKKEDYIRLCYKKFENLKIACPIGYEDTLSQYYGDYKKFVIGKSLHGSTYIDLYNSYEKYNNLSINEFKKLFE